MVFAAIRPGGTAGRTADERIALDLGLLGQETTGAGGISYALRSIPRMLELAREMRRPLPGGVAAEFHEPGRNGHRGPGPGARPQGGRHLRFGQRAGVPGGPGRRRRAARGQARRRRLLRAEPSRLAVPAGVRRPGCPARAAGRRRARWPASRRAGCSRSRSWPSWGACPTSTSITTTRPGAPWPASGPAPQTRGESIDRQQSELYPRLAAAGPAAYPLWEAARRSREEGYLAEARPAGERRDETDLAGGGYERVALAVMRALSGGGPAELILNTPNTCRRRPGTDAAAPRPWRDSGAARGRRRRGPVPGDARRRGAAPAGASGPGAAGPACSGSRKLNGSSCRPGPGTQAAGQTPGRGRPRALGPDRPGTNPRRVGGPRRVRPAPARRLRGPRGEAAGRLRGRVPGTASGSGAAATARARPATTACGTSGAGPRSPAAGDGRLPGWWRALRSPWTARQPRPGHCSPPRR